MTSAGTDRGAPGPRPAPPRAEAAQQAAAGLTDRTADLDAAAELPLQERAAALNALRASLAATLRDAED